VSRGVAVFASGGGSNLQALLDHCHATPDARIRVTLVVSDRPDAGALARAAAADVPTRVIPARGRADADVAAETLAVLEAADVEIVALAGYLRLVPVAVVDRFRGRIVNVHPSLLPAFGGPGMYGTRVHRAVLAAGCTVTGATVHHVDEVYDRGRVFAQWPVPVMPGDDAETLAARVLAVEHVLYPAALDRLAAGLDGAAAEITTAAPASAAAFALTTGDGHAAAAVGALIRSEQPD
jgi:phosphoribosylglycinamide formyltransferase 1